MRDIGLSVELLVGGTKPTVTVLGLLVEMMADGWGTRVVQLNPAAPGLLRGFPGGFQVVLLAVSSFLKEGSVNLNERRCQVFLQSAVS